MNASQSNKLAMYHAVQALLNQVETTALPALATKRTTFETTIASIAVLANTQALPTKGRVLERDLALADMTETALAVAGPVLSYAETNQLSDLAAKVRVWPSHFTRIRKVLRTQLAQRIYEAAHPHAAALLSFGVTAEMLADFKAKIDTAESAISSPRNVAVEKSISTDLLGAAFKNADVFLETQIDPLMWILRKTALPLFARYQAARDVIDRPGGRSATAPDPVQPGSPAVANATAERLAA
jgi:hypothetical protein